MSVPEMRRLLGRLVLAVEQTAHPILAWAHWRRWQQWMAKYDHDTRRGVAAGVLAA